MTKGEVDKLGEVLKEQATQAGQISTIMNYLGDNREQQPEFRDGMNKILGYLNNDPATGTKGVVAKQELLEERLLKLESFEKDVKTRAGIGVFIGGVVFSIISFLAKLIIDR